MNAQTEIAAFEFKFGDLFSGDKFDQGFDLFKALDDWLT